MQQYEYSPYFAPQGCAAQVAGERLAALEAEHGMLTPKLIVEDARPSEAVLHPVFNWHDPAAAELYREWQARALVKSIRVVTVEAGQDVPRRAFVNVTTETQRGYVSSAIVMSDAVLREQVLLKAKADLRAWRERYRDLQELADLHVAIDAQLVLEPVADQGA